MRRTERNPLVHHHPRDHVLQADVRDLAVVHDRCLIRRQLHADLLHFIRIEGTVFPQDLEGIECRLDRRTYRPFLDIRSRNLITLAKLFGQSRRIGMRVVRLKKIIFSPEDVFDTGPTGLNDPDRSDTAARRHSPKVECFLHVLGVAVPCAKAGGLMGGVAQKKSHLRNVKARRAARGRSRAEEWRDAVRAPVTLRFELLSTQGHRDASSNIVAERHGAQEVCPAEDRKSTRLNSSHQIISYAVFCLKKKKNRKINIQYAK